MNKIVAEHFSVEVETVSGFGVGLDAIVTNRTIVRATFTNLSDSLTPFRYRVEGTDSRMYIGDKPVVEFKYTRAGLIGTTFTVFFRDQNGETVSDSYTMHYHVYRYDEPKVVPAIAGASDIVCRRCNGSGEASATGGSVRITAARSYSAIKDVSGTKQVNFCAIRYRWKEAAAAEYGTWMELLPANAADNDIVDVVLNLGLGVATAYDIQVGVIDTAGGTHEVTRRIPTARTPFHLGRGGKNIGLGGFCDYSHTEAIDAFWDARFHKGLEVLGDLAAEGDAQFSGDVSVDGLLTLNGGIGVREVFRVSGTGWIHGQTLLEAVPGADETLLDHGTLFVAEVHRGITIVIGAANFTYSGTYQVLLMKTGDIISGSGSGYFYFKNALSEEQTELMNMAIRINADHELEAYYGSGSVSPFGSSVSVRALYVLL